MFRRNPLVGSTVLLEAVVLEVSKERSQNDEKRRDGDCRLEPAVSGLLRMWMIECMHGGMLEGETYLGGLVGRHCVLVGWLVVDVEK